MPNKTRPPIHVLDYGDTGSGKSTFAATFPKPILVLFFDPFGGKDMPYTNGAESVGDVIESPYGYYRDIMHKDGLIRLEYYQDKNPQEPETYAKFLQRMTVIDGEIDAGYWVTIVHDSITFMEYRARCDDKYRLNVGAKDGRQHYAASKDAIELMLYGHFASMNINIVTLCHIDEKKDEVNGEIVRNPAAPGTLSKRLAAAYGEQYRAFTVRDGDKINYLIQSINNGLYSAQTHINVPNPCYPHYESLWENWNKE
jgi:hypothetical protein